MGKYPTLEKMKEVKDRSQEIGEFLEWLNGKGVHLAVYQGQWLEHSPYNTEQLLAEYFEIDLKQAEVEKRQILEELQKRQQEATVPHA